MAKSGNKQAQGLRSSRSSPAQKLVDSDSSPMKTEFTFEEVGVVKDEEKRPENDSTPSANSRNNNNHLLLHRTTSSKAMVPSGRSIVRTPEPEKISSKERAKRDEAEVKMREREENLQKLANIWSTEVLPKWSAKTRSSAKVAQLVWNGIPPKQRCQVWKAVIGNELNITTEIVSELRQNVRLLRGVAKAKLRAKLAANVASPAQSEAPQTASPMLNPETELSPQLAVHLDTLGQIELDIPRTFPHLKIFHAGGPLYDPLMTVLLSYSIYHPETGYVQGMSYLASVLLLNMEEHDAFIALANLLHQKVFYSFFQVDSAHMAFMTLIFNKLFAETFPSMFRHFQSIGLVSEMFLFEWLLTIFSRSLPLDIAHRIWDNFLYDGPVFLFRTSLGIVRMYQASLIHSDFETALSILTKIPPDTSEELLFQSIAHVFIAPRKYSALVADLPASKHDRNREYRSPSHPSNLTLGDRSPTAECLASRNLTDQDSPQQSANSSFTPPGPLSASLLTSPPTPREAE